MGFTVSQNLAFVSPLKQVRKSCFEFKSVVLVLVVWYWCFDGGSGYTLVITVVMVLNGFGGFCSCCNVSIEYFVAILK